MTTTGPFYIDPSTGKKQYLSEPTEGPEVIDITNPQTGQNLTITPEQEAAFASTGFSRSEEQGIVSSKEPTAEDKLKKASESRTDQLKTLIGENFDEKIKRRRQEGEKEIGGTEAQLGITRGLGASSSRMTFIASQRQQIENDIKDFEKAKADAMINADFTAAEKLDEQLRDLRDYNFKLKQTQFENALNLLSSKEDSSSPLVVAPGSSILDPTTGAVIGTAPSKPSDSEPLTQKIGNTLWQYDMKSDEWKKVAFDENMEPNTIGTSDTGYYQYDSKSNTWNQIIPPSIKPDALTYKQKVDLEVDLANDFEKYAKEARASVRNIDIINTGYQEALDALASGDSLNAPSQAILVTFQKMLDPTSVVRESEYARSGDGQSLKNRLLGAYQKLVQGGAGVTIEDLKNFKNISNELLKGYNTQMLNFAKRTRTQADNYGLSLENILTADVIDLLGNEDKYSPEPLAPEPESTSENPLINIWNDEI